MFRILLLLAVLVPSGYSVTAHAETSHCAAITTLPTVITAPGAYCLKNHLHTSITTGTALAIGASDVILDCNGFDVGGTNAGPSTQAIGIRATNRKRVTVRGCNVRGFRTGIQLSGADSMIEGNNVIGSTFQGMELVLDYSQVRRNRILNTGSASATSAYGMRLTSGRADLISDNLVSGVASAGPSTGIELGAVISVMEENRVLDIAGTEISAVTASSRNSHIVRNSFQTPTISIHDEAVRFTSGWTDSEMTYCTHNTISGFRFTCLGPNFVRW